MAKFRFAIGKFLVFKRENFCRRQMGFIAGTEHSAPGFLCVAARAVRSINTAVLACRSGRRQLLFCRQAAYEHRLAA